MSPQKRFSQTQSPPTHHDLKYRVITCLNKLADRDTLSQATVELDSIARTLTHDSFSSFLNCLQSTDSSSKSPVRKQCVNLLTLLSHSHGNSLSPHLSKMISTVVQRLRDSDSSVRSACIVATTAMSSNITKPSFTVLSKPLIDSVLVEQDTNSQIGGAMCLSAAIEAAPDPEAEQLKKLLPRLGKVVKSEGFKAKAAVLGVIGSVVGVGGAKSKGVLDWVVPCVLDFLSSDDWATRKAAAEVLAKVALAENDLAAQYKNSCLAALESRRFDKVKIVRETMNRSLELWKEVAGVCEEVSGQTPSKSSSIDNSSGGCFPSITKISQDVGSRTPQPKKIVPASRSPSSRSSFGTTAKSETSLKNNDRRSSMPTFSKLDNGKTSDWKVEIAVQQSPSSEMTHADCIRVSDSGNSEFGELGNSINSKSETKSVLFSKIRNEKVYKFGGFRSGSRVVPYQDDENSDLVISNGTEEVYDDQKDAEELSMIREQLLQIENQQSSLLDLLQRFIGSSQSGLNSLESRVHGLEMALEEISYDLALSSGMIPNNESAENTCCKLPGTEFLSSKFWRRTEGRFSTSRMSSSGNLQSLHAVQSTPVKDAISETYKTDNQKLQHPSRNPLPDVHDLRGNSGFRSTKTVRSYIQDADIFQNCNSAGFDGVASSAVCTAPVNMNSRLSA
ncbi:hypothetical protein LWI28_027002 [Acer negundo]|uniref:TORTIFOLIA1/SINE1-2 N-terminal domain-containing protein n=1 Tax=Acer negundo TaxID=4023 RepID=A0AAD5ITT9_ACENE|nr:hypothetical protein LWI28_027002 [Acer negundo]